MSFMQPEIYKADWLEIDTAQGIWSVPAELLPDVVRTLQAGDVDDIRDVNGLAESVMDYTEAYKPDQIYNVELRHGFGARMSAPGYLDCTEWTVFDTEEEASAYLKETYPEEEEDEWAS